MVNHIRQHTGESPHKCTYCTKTFTRKEHLVNHVRQHTGESPHRCSYCNKTFTRKEHLTNHIRLHTGDSPHKCECCQKTFTRKEHLNNHMKQHSSDNAHCCNVCNKPFTRKVIDGSEDVGEWQFQIMFIPFFQQEHLINHMSRCHTGDRPFACETCGKSFPLKGNLIFHQRSHTKGQDVERPFRCEKCPKDFICKGKLRRDEMQKKDSLNCFLVFFRNRTLGIAYARPFGRKAACLFPV